MRRGPDGGGVARVGSSYVLSKAWDALAKDQNGRAVSAPSSNEPPSPTTTIQHAARVSTVASRNNTKCVVDPRSSWWLPWWDLITGVALTFTAICTPFEVSFLPVQVNALFWINRAVDVVFGADLVLNFFLAFPTEAHQSQQGAHWVEDRRLICKHYLSGWFWLDGFSTATSAFDIMTVLQSDEAVSSLSKFKAFRVIRVLRLFKLLRLLRGTRLLQRWETRLRINYGVLALIQSMLFVVFFAHWSACAWMLQVSVRDSLTNTWLYNAKYCIDDPALFADDTSYAPPADVHRYTARPTHGFEGQYVCMESSDIYSAAFYWAVMTITSVGYGDIVATPRQWTEQVIASLLMLSGAFVWSQVVATFCGVISTMSPGTTDFRLTLDSLNAYMSLHNLPGEMRQRLRDFFHRTRHLWQSNASHQALMRMSPALQGEVLLHTNAKWLSGVSWLAFEDPRFLTQLILQLQAAVFAPSEVIRSTALHIVNSGVAIHGGRLIRHGGVWGVDMLIAAPHLRSRTLVRAITYVEVYYIDRDTVLSIAAGFTDSLERIRRRTRYLALQRSVVLIAKVSRTLNSHHSKAEEKRAKTRQARRPTQEGSPSFKVGRWKSALGLWQTHHNAERSFMQKHIRFKGSTEEGRRTGMVLGSDLDQRVERSREQHLCSNLFAIAAAARSGKDVHATAAPPVAAAVANGTGGAHEVGAGVVSFAPAQDQKRSNGYAPTSCGSGVLARAGPAPARSPEITKPAARRGSQGKISDVDIEDANDLMDEGRPMRSRPSHGRMRRNGNGYETLCARVDSLAASNEDMSRQLQQLTAALSTHMGMLAVPTIKNDDALEA